MKRVLAASVVSGGIVAASLAPAPASGGAPIPEVGGVPVASVADIVSRVTPGVVGISVRGEVREVNPLAQDPLFRQFFDFHEQPIERETEAVGSGVIVNAERGYVLTNSHVIDNATKIKVTTKDNRSFDATLVGRDTGTDIALLQIPTDNLTAVPMGDSSRLRVGDFVLAIGNPFGLGQTVTSGIVSALGRTGLGIEGYEDFIQTDASINPGNSGGALVNLQGQLVGISTAILAPGGGNIGIGFAVPINMARDVMDQLTRYGEVRHGHIGVAIQDLTPELARALGTVRTEGALIARVEPGSAAQLAGLRARDLIVSVNGTPIHNAAELKSRVGLAQIGGELQLTVDRDGAERVVDVRIGKPTAVRQYLGRR
ncbi:MAG: Do family serine endopeptidase [Alphaproteobacteria bacterium]|nr:Do family serine endopeptidase [Alphaproteobacteria bacterium]